MKYKLLHSAVFIFLFTAAAWGQFSVSSTSPAKNQLNISAGANITINFNQSMNIASITTSTVKVYGSYTGYHSGVFTYGATSATFNPINDFKPGEIVIVSVTTGVQNASNQAMTNPYVYSFTVDAPLGYAKFKSPANYTVNGIGSGNYASVIADLDGDGDLDIATTATLYDQLSVFKNNGDGTFASAVNYATLTALDVKAADVDGDGDMDLVTANISAHGVSVFVNNGGTFSTRNDFDFSPTQSNSGSVVVVDMDGDGDIDIVASDLNNATINVLKNNGSGSFTSTAYPITIKLNPLAYGDLDKDGDMDIVGSNGTVDSVEYFINDGTGALTFNTRFSWTGSGYTAPIIADINSTFGDKMDLIYANATSNTITYWYDGLGPALGSANTSSVGGYPDGLAAVDVDSDNDQDLLVANHDSSTFSLLSNNGSASFTKINTYPVSGSPNDVRAADLNGDGAMDVVTSNSDGKISVMMNYNGGHVSSVAPVNGALNQNAATNIVITFDENINSATLTSSTIKVFGSLSGAHSWTLSSYNSGTYAATIDPTNDFKPGEVVTVTVTTGVQNGNAIALEKGYASSFTVAAGNTAGVFGAKTDYASGNQAKAVVVADLNADGYADLAAANFADNNISVFINNGNGTYASAVTYTAGNGPSSIAAGDINGDGKVDLVVASTTDNVLSLLTNNNNTGFNAATTVSMLYATAPNDVKLADIDSDGDLDLVYTTSNNVYYQKNNGSGSFSSEENGSSGTTPVGVSVADIDNDGDLDFLTANNASSTVRVAYYNGSNWYSSGNSFSVGNYPMSIVTGDFNNDGYVDVVTGNVEFGNGTISYLQNNHTGGFATKVDYTVGTGAQPRGLTAVDFDGDGDLDIVVANSAGNSAVVFTNNGSGIFTNSAQYTTGTSPYAIASADIDGDGDMDIVTANNSGNSISILKNSTQVLISSVSPTVNAVNVTTSSNVTVTFNQSMNSGTLTTSTIKVVGSIRGNYSGVVSYNDVSHTATFNPDNNFKAGENITVLVKTGVQNNDGVALSTPDQWSFVATASAEGTFGGRLDYTLYGIPDYEVTADMNGDGAPDVVSTSTYWDNATSQNLPRIEVKLNNGSGALGTSDTTYLGVDFAYALAVTDVDGDGDLDVVLTTNDYMGGGYLEVLLNDGTGHLSAPVKYFAGDNYSGSIGTGDLNGDGYNDIAIVLSGFDLIKTYLNNGSGGFIVSDSISTGVSVSSSGIALSDIDGDGDLDILTCNYNSGTVLLSKNNGNGIFAAPTTFSGGTGVAYPDGIAAGDLNGDGAVDLAVSDNGDGKISVLLNSGSGTFSTPTVYTDNNPSYIKLADMDGDGDLDIVTSATSIYKISVRANNGSGTLSAASMSSTGNYPSDFSIADMDGDGDLDIVVAKDNSTVSVIKNIELVKVNTVSPTASAHDVAATSNITATFNVDINAATLVDTTVIVHGSITGKIAGAITYDSPSKTVTFNPTNDFLAGEEVTLTLTTNIKNTNGINLHSASTYTFTVHAAGAGNFVYHDTIPDLGQDASFSYYYANLINSGDVTGDRKIDLLAAYSGKIKTLKNNTTSFDSISSLTLASTQDIPLADLDNDGDLDMMQATYSNLITPALNDGSGNFTAQTSLTGGNNPQRIVLKDMDGDGKIDVTESNGFGGSLMNTFYNDGTGHISSSNYSSAIIHYDMWDYACADVDNDGLNDIISLHSGNGNNFVTITKNTGDRKFATPVDYSIAVGGKKMATADVNGDGYVDVIVANQDGMFFSVLLNNGNGTFATAVDYSIGFTLYQIAAADIDGDGDADLVIKGYDNNSNKDKIVIAYNNGSGNFGNQNEINIKSGAPDYYYSYSNFTLLDIDNDGDLDIATHANHYYGTNQYENTLLFENAAGSSSAPTTAASNITASGISGTSATINWTNGDGARRLVLVKQGSAVNGTPADNSNFSPNPQFGSGTQVGTGNYVVYGGSGSSTTVTGLSKSTTYYVSVFEMNGPPGSEKVLTTSAPTASFTTTQFDGPFDATPGYALSYNNHWDQTNNNFSLSDSFTIELWVKPSTIGSDMVILDHGSDDMWIGVNASGNFYARVWDNNSSQNITFTGTTVAVANQWYHLALTAITGDSARLYVNGTLEAKSANVIGSVWTSSDVFYSGGDFNTASYLGLIDELRLWGCVRSASEIRTNMHKTFEGIPANLKGYWQFNEGTGNTVVDHVNGNSFIPSGGSLTFVSSNVPVGGGSNTSTSVSANATGLQTIGNVQLNMTTGFSSPTDVYVSEVSVAPNSYPTNFNSSVGNKYFIIDAFPYPDSGTFSATLTLSYGAGVLTDAVASNYILYKRGSSSSGDWTSYGTASSVNTSTGEVTWTNIASFSQAIVVNQNSALPVELAVFSATPSTGKVELHWKTATEVNNAGFEIERSTVDVKASQKNNWKKIGSVNGNGTSNTSHEYSFVDTKAQNALRYRLKQIDRDGSYSYSQILEINVVAPIVFELKQNYPNPFNPTTTIEFTIPKDGMTTLKIYNSIGQEVTTLVNEELKAGEYHQAIFNAQNFASGVYFARLQNGHQVQLKKMMMLK